jgi:hypothetical protein
MSIIIIPCKAKQYSVTTDTLVLSGDDPALKTVTIGHHNDGEANVGTYAKNSAILRVSQSQFDIAVDAFSDGAWHDISLGYENTLKKNNVDVFTCPNEIVSFVTGTAAVVPAPAAVVPAPAPVVTAAIPATDGQ